MIRINNVEYDISNSFSIDERLDEALDSGCIKILNITDRELTFKPTTELYIEEFGNVYDYFVVDYCEDEIVSFNPFLKNVNVFFIERTKLLERHTLSNHSITQSLLGNHKTIGKFINDLISTYDLPYILDVSFADEYAPEVSFSQPTFKEVLDLLFMIYDSVPFLQSDNKIIAIPLQKNNKEINTNYLHKIEYSQKMEDYCDGLDMSLENVVPKNKMTATLKTFRSDDIVMNDNNYCVYLEKPIYEINEYILWYKYYDSDVLKYDFDSVDITDYVYDEREYQTLDATKKESALYYKSGDNYIRGYTNTQGFFGKATILNILERLVPKERRLYLDIDNLIHKIKYKGLDVLRAKTEKINSENLTYLFNAQNEPYIDITETGNNLYNRTDRIGNKKMTIYGIYPKNAEIPVLGDYIDKYILVEKKLQINKNFTVFVGELSYNYIRKNEFIALSSLKRVYQFDIEGALVRNVLSKQKIKLRFNRSDDEEIINGNIIFGWLNYINYTTNQIPVKIKNTFANLEETNDFLLEASAHIFGKSFLITFGFADNYKVSNKVGSSVTGGKEMEACRYVDENGEYTFSQIEIYNSYYPILKSESWEEYKKACDNLPIYNSLLLKGSTILDNFFVKTNKDNREIIKMTRQYEILTDENIFITDYFYEIHPLYTGMPFNYQIMTQSYPFTKEQKKCNGTILSNATANLNNSGQIIINNANSQFVAITDTNKNILISINCLQNQRNVVLYL